MSYTPFLVANMSTGIYDKLQPWLIPDDAQQRLFDGFVYRGVMSKREGYVYFATGQRGGTPYRESRIVHLLENVVPTSGSIDGTNAHFEFALQPQIARGSVVITGDSPAQVLTDNGIGGFTGDGTGTIDYITGVVEIDFATPPDNASSVTASYSYMPGNPVMMIANFVTATNVKDLIVADTRYINRYNSTTNVLEDITNDVYTGTKFNFFSWVNYASPTFTPRLIFTNNKDDIQVYDPTASPVVDAYSYNMLTSASSPVDVTSLQCLLVFEIKDRLILLRTTENGIVYPQRIRISGTGANCDDFRTSATGAGFIDIPDGTWIQGATPNRDDLLIFTEQATWVMKYTGNDTTPFVINRIDESRGSQAPFACITYLNRSSAASKRGLIISDGYKVERQDDSIPDFTFNEVDQTNFALCFAGVFDKDRDHYLIYPDAQNETSNRILTTNYDEDNYCIYRLPLSCMGVYQTAFTYTWNDLTAENGFANWDQLTTRFGNWNAFSYSQDEPFPVGGGQNGEIWRLVVSESEDNEVRIYSITVIDDDTLEITTDFNNFSLQFDEPEMGADFIYLSGMDGMDEIKNQQFPIVSIINPNTFRINVSMTLIPASSMTPYVSGGSAVRVIPFSALMKEFNPFVEQDKKVRCGWLYMYVDTTETQLVRNVPIDNATQSNPCVITTEIPHGMKTGEQVTFFGVAGMTELNGLQSFVNVINATSFSLRGVDSSGFTPYTSGGFVSINVVGKILIDVFTDDRQDNNTTELNDNVPFPYEGNCTNISLETGTKKWYKVFINQLGKFIQFRFRNQQAGAQINIQAFMPGFQPTGRLI